MNPGLEAVQQTPSSRLFRWVAGSVIILPALILFCALYFSAGIAHHNIQIDFIMMSRRIFRVCVKILCLLLAIETSFVLVQTDPTGQ